jgi:hypothetical protein
VSRSVLEAIAVTCELTSTSLSEAAIRVMVDSLSEYPEPQVLGALRKCCKELKSKLTLADILTRMDDGRPGVEEAWAMLSTVLGNEQVSLVWTEEVREAYGVVALLVDDPIAARMAFKERYTALVSTARDRHEPVKWLASLGYDLTLREAAVRDAVERKRLTQEQALKLCPFLPPVSGETMKLLGGGDDLSAMP